MHNVDLPTDDALEFLDLQHKRRDRTSSSLDSGELEVGKEFSSKDSFLGTLKQYSIMNEVNYHMVKSTSEKFKAKCAVQDGVSQDHPKIDSDMIASLMLSIVKTDPGTSVSVLIVNIRSQLRHTTALMSDALVYYKPLVQIDGTFMYGRYTHRLLLVVAQDGGGRILPIVFTITAGESGVDWDFFLSRLMRHVYPQPDICVISDQGTGILAAIER
ncbi:hypothetical protein J1N35_038580 [Gossypium stocksii]|uniref:MULE transposase domain-containing protein n=1 Tax=Gossypium stocksii TaxID=47602 RepID=A0A9D3UMB1_9ROSI|nr:hypothetical protein J1N35_038580 [Gossypium stocksii]